MKKILLMVAGLMLSILFYREAYITSILHYHDRDVFSSYTSEPVVEGTTIQGEFVATGDNLSTVKLRINTLNRMNTTHITFRLRQKGSSSWQVANTYATDRMADGLLYPFGFPPIQDSKGKIYEFELTSDDGEEDNAIGVASGYHAVASLYVFTKDALIADRGKAIVFIKEKLGSMVSDPYLWLYEMMFLVPFLGFIIKRRALLLAYLLLVYIYLPVDMHSNIILYVAAAGAYLGHLSRASARIAYLVGILCLIEIPFALAFGNTLAANRSATLVFFSLLTAGIMSIRELKQL